MKSGDRYRECDEVVKGITGNKFTARTKEEALELLAARDRVTHASKAPDTRNPA